MNGRKARKIRRLMDQLRRNPPPQLKRLIEVETERQEQVMNQKPLQRGVVRVYPNNIEGQYRNPTRTIKNIATSILG